jgi:hypothetical protein
MAEFPQYKESQPVFQPVNVASGAEGYEEFAKTLGSIAQSSEKVAETIAEDRSNAMYLSSVANVDELKLSMQEQILTDPANAMKHVETMRDSLDKMTQAAYVNKSDRSKLQQYSSKSLNATELDAIQASVKQSQIGAAFEHYENWPAQLNVLKEKLRSGDAEGAATYQEALLKQIKTLVLARSLTPLQGGAAIKSMSDVVDLEKDVHDMVQNVEGHTPEAFHAVMTNPIDKNKANNLNYPVDENTNWLVNYHASDRSFVDASDGIQQHQFNVQAYENMTPNQRNEIKQQFNGVRMADGLINSNAPLPKIQARVDELKGRTDYSSLAEKKALTQYMNDLSNGNSQRLMARTTIGGRIVRDFADTQSYLNNKLTNTKPDNVDEVNSIKAEMAKNKNTYVNNSIAYAQAHHWPTVHPIPYEDVATVENGFNAAGDPAVNAANAYNTFKQYSPQNQLYFADQMKNPKQKVVMQAISLGGTRNSDRDNLDFITANQNRKYTSADPNTGNAITDDYLKNSVNVALTDSLKVIQGQNDPATAAMLNSNLVQSGMNYAHFIAQKNLQFSKKDGSTYNADNYVPDVAKYIKNAFEPMSGANYMINRKQNDIEPAQMDAIAQYAINEGNAYLRRGMSESAHIELMNRSPLTVTISPKNIVQARDVSGNIAYSAPLTSDLKARAVSEMKKLKAEKGYQRQQIFKTSKENRKFLSPEEQWINVIPGVE